MVDRLGVTKVSSPPFILEIRHFLLLNVYPQSSGINYIHRPLLTIKSKPRLITATLGRGLVSRVLFRVERRFLLTSSRELFRKSPFLSSEVHLPRNSRMGKKFSDHLAPLGLISSASLGLLYCSRCVISKSKFR